MSGASDDEYPREALSEEGRARRGFLLKLFLPVVSIAAVVTQPAPAEAQSLFNAIIRQIRFPGPYRGGGRSYRPRRRHIARRSHHRRVASSPKGNSKSSSQLAPKLLD